MHAGNVAILTVKQHHQSLKNEMKKWFNSIDIELDVKTVAMVVGDVMKNRNGVFSGEKKGGGSNKQNSSQIWFWDSTI